MLPSEGTERVAGAGPMSEVVGLGEGEGKGKGKGSREGVGSDHCFRQELERESGRELGWGLRREAAVAGAAFQTYTSPTQRAIDQVASDPTLPAASHRPPMHPPNLGPRS